MPVPAPSPRAPTSAARSGCCGPGQSFQPDRRSGHAHPRLPLLAVNNLRASTLDVGCTRCLPALSIPDLRATGRSFGWPGAGLIRSMLLADLVRGVVAALLSGHRRVGRSVDRRCFFAGGAYFSASAPCFFQVGYQSVRAPKLVDDQRRWHGANTRLSLSESTHRSWPVRHWVVWSSRPCRLRRRSASDALTYGARRLCPCSRSRHGGGARRVDPAPASRLPFCCARSGRALITCARDPDPSTRSCWTGALYKPRLGDVRLDARDLRGPGPAPFPGSPRRRGRLRRHRLPDRQRAFRRLLNAPSRAGPFAGVGGPCRPSAALLVGRAGHPGPMPVGGWPSATLVVGVGQGCFAVNAITLRQARVLPRDAGTSEHRYNRFVSWGALGRLARWQAAWWAWNSAYAPR